MGKRIRKLSFHMKLFYLCVIVFIAVWLYTLFVSNGYFGTNPFTGDTARLFNSGWTDQAGNPVAVPAEHDVSAGESFRVFYTVDADLGVEPYLLFRTDHTFVRAYVNGIEVYRFGSVDEIPFGKSPGSGWQLIPLGSLSEGDVITLETNCPYQKYSGLLRDIRIGTKNELVSYVLRHGLGMLAMTVVPFLIGLTIIVLPPMFFRGLGFKPFLNIGLSFLVISVWSFTEAQIWQIFYQNHYAMQMLNFLTFSLVAPCITLAMHTLGFVRGGRSYRTVLTIGVVTAFALLLLQLFEIADYFETLVIIHLLMGGSICTLIRELFHGRKREATLVRNLSLAAYMIVIVGAALDMADFYIWDTFGNGFFTRIALFCLLVFAGVMAVRRAFNVHVKIIETRTYEKMAYTDNLTALRNRRGFDEDVATIKQGDREVSFLCADMDGLKQINDTQGHGMGDEAIMTIAQALTRHCGETETCYRVGGDEFYVISFARTPEELETMCAEINRELAGSQDRFGHPLGISYGAVRFVPGLEQDVHQLLMMADRKMYCLKEKQHAANAAVTAASPK